MKRETRNTDTQKPWAFTHPQKTNGNNMIKNHFLTNSYSPNYNLQPFYFF